MRETSATDGYYTQYILSTYLLVPNSVIDLFSSHCAKICVFNREKKNPLCNLYANLPWKNQNWFAKSPPPIKKKHSE